jgi:hypothetical protein
MMGKVLWWATCAVAWIGRLICTHPNPQFEGNGIVLAGHREYSEQSWHCLKCGKRYSLPGHYEGREARLENIFQEGAEACVRGESMFDSPYRMGTENYFAWQRGFKLEAGRFDRDPK